MITLVYNKFITITVDTVNRFSLHSCYVVVKCLFHKFLNMNKNVYWHPCRTCQYIKTRHINVRSRVCDYFYRVLTSLKKHLRLYGEFPTKDCKTSIVMLRFVNKQHGLFVNKETYPREFYRKKNMERCQNLQKILQ